MPQIINLGSNSLSTKEWLSVSKRFCVSGYHSDDLMSSFTANVRPILNQERTTTGNRDDALASDSLPYEQSK
jgi:hypothetical protein